MATTTQRIVLITGCSSGIGRETAAMLLQRGHRVYPTARRDESVQELHRAFQSFADNVHPLHLDVTNTRHRTQAVETIIARDGRIDALVNNAAFGQLSAVEDVTVEEMHKQFDVNVTAAHELTRLVLPHMRAHRFGRIINVSSVAAHGNLPLMGVYNASKAALNALSDCLRLELHGSGIDVVLIEPGAIRTAFRENAFASVGDRATDPRSPYHAMYRATLRRWQKKLGEKAAPPQRVARAIVHAVEHPRPRTRYRITASATLAPLGFAILPDRIADALIRRLFKTHAPKPPPVT